MLNGKNRFLERVEGYYMNIIFVDDELNAHVNFRHDMATQENITSLHCFFTADEALTYTEHNAVDCAFLDIDLGEEISGLDLARNLKAIQPDIEVAFLTAFDEYTKDSYQIGGRAYLTKPYLAEELESALQLMRRLIQPHKSKPRICPSNHYPVKIRTFGNFDLIVDGRAVVFKTSKAKEALAFLVDQMGGSVSGVQMFMALWEEQEYNSNTSVYIRRTIRALKAELVELNIPDILVCGRNNFSVNMTLLDCDIYKLLNGDENIAFFYKGEYMSQYSWGESTIPLLDRAAKRILSLGEN